MTAAVSESVMIACYARIKREHPTMPEGEILERAAQACGTTRARIGEALREEPPAVKRYAIILPAE